MRYLMNRDNLARLGTVSATNIVPSTAITRTDSAPKAGGGAVSLAGAYTGSADAEIEVEILDESGATRRVSAPQFVGVGSGSMSGQTAANTVTPQLVTITLENLGVETRAAQAPFQSAVLVAQAAGNGGNAITVTVDNSALVDADTPYALQEDLREGVNEYIGDQWNFGAAALNPDGTIPATAPRIRFGIDPQVYRPFRRYVGGRWVYGFSPAPVRSVLAGANVYAVSGSRTITISDGVDTETFPGIVTLFDGLSAIRDTSALVRVEGAIVQDRRPGGQGITDLSVYTQSYAASRTADGTEFALEAEFPIIVAPTAPTEVLTITCTDASQSGAERWSVRGQVSGRLSDAITNALYSAGSYSFRIPLVPSPVVQAANAIAVNLIAQRNSEAARPTLCVEEALIGRLARATTYEFEWRTRPEPCPCDTEAEIEGGPDPDLLGITLPEGASTMSEASRIIRVQRLANYVAQHVRSNTDTRGAGNADVSWVGAAAAILSRALTRVAGGTPQWPVWAADTAITADTVREPTARNGYRYAYSGGTTGATEPSWPTAVGATVADASGTWTNVGETVWALWDREFDLFVQDAERLAGSTSGGEVRAQVWTGSVSDPFGGANPQVGVLVLPTAVNGHVYRLERFTSAIPSQGGSEPTWPTNGGTVADGDFVWRDLGAYWSASASYSAGDIVRPYNGFAYRATTGGTSGASEPVWPLDSGIPVADGGVTWEAVARNSGTNLFAPTGDDLPRYEAAMNKVLAAAGIDPDFEGAGLGGNRVWRDRGGDAWFECISHDLLPIQPGYYYHSARLATDETGRRVPVSTQEFGVGIDVPCAGLVDGDLLRITIDLEGVARATYQQGDAFQVQVNRADPLALSGGQDGDDTLTWSVIGSASGRLADYELDLAALAPYSDGDIGFAITPGAVPFALGDHYTFRVEAARAQWRVDGGSWSAPIEAAGTVALTAGLSAVFSPGVAPSWVAGDRWGFLAEAINGPARALQPTDDALSWTGSTAITITPAAGAIEGLLIADHTIPADATIELQGSDDGFGTVSSTQAVAWRARHIWVPIDSPRLAYRLVINRGGSIRWLWLGDALQPSIPTGRPELGALVRRYQLPGIGRRLASGGTVRHEALTQSAVDDLVGALGWACDNDRRLIGILISDTEAAVVRLPDDPIEVEDLFDHQPADANDRRLTLSIDLEAAA
jgi:hypothetical protein